MARRPPDEERNIAGGAAAPRGGGSGPAIASGGLSFDTSGLKDFTAAMTKAGQAVKEFWLPFEKADRHQRTVDTFFRNLKRQVTDIKREAEGIDLTGGVAGGRPGATGSTGSRLGGDSRVPALPVRPAGPMVQTHGAGLVGAAWSAREAVASRDPAHEARAFPVTGRVAVAGALTSAAGRMMGNLAQRRLPIATNLQQAATQATLVGGTGGQEWSRAYRDQVQRNLTQAQGGWGGVHAAAASQIGANVGLPVTGTAGGTGQQFMHSARMLSNLDPMGQTEDVAAAGLAGLSRGAVSNQLRAAGIRVSPGGVQRDPTDVFKDLTKALFGTDKPSSQQAIQARIPDTPRNLQLQTLLGGDQALMEQYLKWLEASVAVGAPIETMAQSERAPGARGMTGAVRRAEARKGRAEGRVDAGVLSTAEQAEELREGAYGVMDDVLKRFPMFGEWLGKASTALMLLTGAITPLVGILGGAALGSLLKGGGGGGGGGVLGGAGRLVGGAARLAGGAAAVGGAAAAGAAIGTGISRIGVGGGNTVAGWLGDRSSGVLDTMGFLGDTGEVAATGAGRKRMHKGKQIYKGKTRYSVEGDKPGATYAYGSGPFPELKPDAATPGVGDPVIGAVWNPYMHGSGYDGDVGDPVPPSGAKPGGELPGKGSQGLNSDFKSKLAAMFAENPKLNLTSGFRSYDEQARLYDRWKRRVPGQAPAAPPGKSNHEKGLAADIGPSSQYGWLAQNAPRFGLKKPMSYEPWHWEPTNAVGGSTTPVGGSAAAPTTGTTGGASTEGYDGAAPAAGDLLQPSLNLGGGLFGGGAQHSPSSDGATDAAMATGATTTGGAAATGGGGGGGTIGVDQAVRLARAAGFSGDLLKTMVAIAMAESNLRTGARGDTTLENATWGPSIGLWQVRTLKAQKGKGTTRDENALMASPEKQAQSAMEVYKSQGLSAWSVWKSGAYKKNMGAVEAALGGSGGGSAGGGGGIGDPIYAEDTSVSAPILGVPVPGRSDGGGSGGGGGGLVIHNATFKVEIASASPEDAERAARQIMDLLSNNERLLEAAES